MHETPEWKEVLTKNGWTDAFVTGDEFGAYMDEQTKRVEDVLTTLGLA
jgi:putative tricarboxylic transport membrane protein